MNISTLKKILTHRPLHVSGDFRLRGELFETGELVRSEWADEFNKKHNDPPAEKDSRTYDRCTHCIVNVKAGKVMAEVRVHEGSILDGAPERLRCTYYFQLKKASKHLTGHAEKHLRDLAVEAVEREDEEIYNLRIKAAQEKLLSA